MLAFVVILLIQITTSERSRLEAQALDKARNISLAVDRTLGGLSGTLLALATSPDLKSGDLAGFYQQAATLRDRTGYWVILRDRASGQQLLNTRRPFGSKLPVSNLPHPSEEAVSSGVPIVTGLIVGAVVKASVVAVELVPAVNRSYVLSLPVSTEALRDLLIAEHPPDGWTASIVDHDGRILARNRRHEDFVGAVATADYLANTQGPEKTWYGTTVDGEQIFGAFARCSLSGWRVGIGVKRSDLDAPLRRFLLWLAALGIVLLALAVLLTRLIGRRITRSLSQLTQAAGTLGRGELVSATGVGLDEVDQVSAALATASQEVRARESAKAALAAIVSSSNDAILSFAPEDGRIQTWNKCAERLFGYTESEAVGRSQAMLQPPEQPEGPDGLFGWAMAGRAVLHHETIRIGKSGERIPVAISATRLDGDDGRIIGVSATYHDLRERAEAAAALTRAEAERRRIEARYELIVESATEFAIITTDLAGSITAWNTGAETILGWTREEAVGHAIAMIFTEEDRATAIPEAEMGNALARGRAGDDRWHLRNDGSRFFASGVMLPKRDAGQVLGFLKILRDRTKEREAEEAKADMNAQLERLVTERTAELSDANARLLSEAAQRQQAEDQLRQSQKMEAVGRLTGGIAHDFNNLLTVVKGSLDLASRRIRSGSADERVSRLIDQAVEGADRAAALTHRLLAFSRQQPLAPEPIDANRLVNGMSDLLRRTIGEDIAIETVRSGGLWKTHADPNQLENALLNLAVNARDAMPDGGKLTIETANAHLDEAYARTRQDVSAGRYVMIAVCDTGSGMSPEVVAQAFEPFFTTKPVGKGTGLGLSQVCGFAKQSGGHVAIYSEPGHGTTIKLYLPRFRVSTDTVKHPSQDRAQIESPHTGNGELILVIEDESSVREFTTLALQEAGYTVLAAEDGPTGLALLDANPSISMLFTDVVLIGPLNGRKVADEALRRRPELPVLFTTGYTRNAIIHHGRLDEDVKLITKPFTAAELAAKVSEILGRPATEQPKPNG